MHPSGDCISNPVITTDILRKIWSFKYRLVDLPKPGEKNEKVNETGTIESPDIAPGQKGKLKMFLPVGFVPLLLPSYHQKVQLQEL